MTESLADLLLLCGLGAPVFHLVLPLALGIFDREHDSMRQYISELAMSSKSLGSAVSASFVLAGTLTVASALGAFLKIPLSPVSWIAPLMLAINGVSNIVAGLFPLGLTGAADRIHSMISQIGSTGAAFTPLLFWVAIKPVLVWRVSSCWSLIMQPVILMVFIIYIIIAETRDRAFSKQVLGLVQRLYLGTYYLWFVMFIFGLVA